MESKKAYISPILDCFVLLLYFYSFAYSLMVIVGLFTEITINLSIIFMLFSYVAILDTAFRIYTERTGKKVVIFKKTDWLAAILTGLLTVIALFLINIVFSLFFETTSNVVSDESLNVIFYSISSILFAPVFEEVFFRKTMYLAFESRGKQKSHIAYILTSSILFALMHVIGIISGSVLQVFLMTFTSGVIFSILYLKTDNIMYPIIAHGLYNLLIVMMALG